MFWGKKMFEGNKRCRGDTVVWEDLTQKVIFKERLKEVRTSAMTIPRERRNHKH